MKLLKSALEYYCVLFLECVLTTRSTLNKNRLDEAKMCTIYSFSTFVLTTMWKSGVDYEDWTFFLNRDNGAPSNPLGITRTTCSCGDASKLL